MGEYTTEDQPTSMGLVLPSSDIAILGFSFKLPQDVEDDVSFWDVLQERKNLMTKWPESRFNAGSFVGNSNKNANKVLCHGGHFINEDVAVFDAPFFSLTAKEAASMDPLQRWTLETSYRAFENAGITVSSLRNSRTAVFSASMTEDWARMTGMDPDNTDRTAVTGTVASLIPNRLSFYYDLHGPSIHVDTACSASLSALDMACKVLRDGDASAALVTGSNLILDPSVYQMLSSQKFLSPTSLCHSFDHRANGYARGEGVIALVLKPLVSAVRDGDMIRAVIRSCASNQDGHTPGLTQPSPRAQEDLIRHVYSKAGLPLTQTRYVEAHGTGTPVGDPIEMKAIGRVFRESRSPEEPLYVGSVKANIGHLEGASGLAGILKAIFILEKGIIPGQANFENINPAIDVDFLNVTVPTNNTPWPSAGVRRVSINSFGFGGSNTHVILDDAFHYLQERGLTANHCTADSPPALPGANISVPNTSEHGVGVKAHDAIEVSGITTGKNGVLKGTNGDHHNHVDASKERTASAATPDRMPTLLTWSAADEKSAIRTSAGYQAFYADKIANKVDHAEAAEKLDQLAYTLTRHRSHMLWRTFAIVDNLTQTSLEPAKPVRSSAEVGLAFVFTGQGAQYVDMGWDLVRYPAFRSCLKRIDTIYKDLGCQWSIFDELRCGNNIDRPEYSQPLSTAIQIALLELLESFGIVPKAVIGHSSGEIAAAYAIKALSLESACKASYFRGQLAGRLRVEQSSLSPSAMLSVNLAEDEVDTYLQSVAEGTADDRAAILSLNIACHNSPLNCTLSGLESAVDAVKAQADKDGIFAAKLKTGVAYHSDAMLAIADEYRNLMGSLDGGGKPGLKATPTGPIMISSVSGQVVRNKATLATAQYWVENMVSRVRFADAVRLLTQQSSVQRLGLGPITDIVEVGPHPALKRPVQDTLSQGGKSRSSKIRYASALHRNSAPVRSTLELAGLLCSLGHPVDITAINNSGQEAVPSSAPKRFLVDCPAYPFDRSQRYWAESRISRDFRLREEVAGETLGMRATDWNPLAPRWRAFLCTEMIPWISHHVVSKTVLFPAAGMLIMAIEAVQQQVEIPALDSVVRKVAGYLVKEARFTNPIIVPEAWEDRTEVQVQLRPIRRQQHEKEATWFDITVSSYARNRWTECCTARIQVEYADAAEVDGGKDRRLADEAVRDQYQEAMQLCTLPVDSRVFYEDASKSGLEWGEWFQTLQGVSYNSTGTAVARFDTGPKYQTTSFVHPAVLDGVFHMLRAAAGQQPVTNVPVRLADAWFAASGWQHPRTASIRWTGTSQSKKAGFGERGSIYGLADDGSVLCAIRDAETTAVSTTTRESDDSADANGIVESVVNKRQLMHSVEWKPQLSLLDKRELASICSVDTYTRDETSIMAGRAALCSVLDIVTARALAGFLRSNTGTSEISVTAGKRETLRRHVDWMHRQVARMSPAQLEEASSITDAELEARFCEVEALLPAWKLYTVVSRQLPAILADEVDPLQIIFESDDAAVFYADIFESVCADGRMDTFLDLAAHENPALRILEVGAGTGGVTHHVIRALQEREARTGGLSFAEYTYTDVSPMFLEGAKSRWPELQGRMTFTTFDLVKDAASQTLELGSYDLVIAGSVLHATPDLNATLRNVRTLLKPGGHLVALETIDPEDIATNFWTGLVPGWWVAREDWRPYSAAIPESQWEISLRATGYSGNDLTIRDYKNNECHFLSVIISTAVVEGETKNAVTKPVTGADANCGNKINFILIVDDAESEQQKHLVSAVLDQLKAYGDIQHTSVIPFTQDRLSQADLEAENTVAICLAEVNNKPLLTSLSNERFQCLQHLVKRVPSLLWATATDVTDSMECEAAHYGTVQGFIRTIRCEQSASHLVSLAIEGQLSAEECAKHIAHVFTDAFKSSSPEVEYVVRHGQIQTGRAVHNPTGEDLLQSLIVPRLQQKAWGDATAALKLEVGAPGTLDSLRFVEDASHETELSPSEVEIEAKAWGLNFRDVLIALGREEGDGLGADCAGIVTRIGRDCKSSLRPGDRVVMVAEGCMRRYPRAHEGRVLAIPDSLSLESAASVLVPGLTAYHCLVDIARLQKGDRVLIHSAAGSTGQMAVRIAQMLGAQVLVTTSSPEKRQFLTNTFGIPEDCIFNSRTTSFAQGVMRATHNQGVDCVLNSLSGDGLRASWECMAPFGRFIDIGLADINANAELPMAMFSKNVSFRAVHLMWLSPSVTAKLLEKTMWLLDMGLIQPPQPMQAFRLPEIEQAFRHLQSGKNIGRIVITPHNKDIVPQFAVERRSWTLESNASYLVAGGFGGLGRAILKWMAERGAKHLIVPSRSGASGVAAAELVADLTARGVHVFAPQCDVSSRTDLATTLAEYERSGAPPIRGCINASMVLQDAIFENMTFAQWDLCLRSKMQTAWNLHVLLGRDLDFFILLSSLAGVIGQASSANYSAGCAYQDALARHRAATAGHGQRNLSLDIGWIGNIGIIAETAAYQRRRQADQDLQTIDGAELLALLTLACDPAAGPSLQHHSQGQVLFGLRTPADFLALGQEPLPQLTRPLFGAFSYRPSLSGAASAAATAAEQDQPAALFRRAADPEEHAAVVLRALAGKLALAMSISPDDIEPSKPLSSYGVDSLMAVELRNWIGREFSATLAVFDIMGGAPISSIASLVVERSAVKAVDENR